MKSLKTFLFILLLAALGIGYSVYHFANSPTDESATASKIEFDLLHGMRPAEIAASLEKSGIVSNAHYLYWLGKFTGDWSHTKAADYELSPSMSPLFILKTLRSGIGIQHSILVREGENIYQVADSFQNVGLGTKDSVLKYMKSPEFIANLGLGQEGIRTLEGYLFPNTYFYDKHDEPMSVIRRMVNDFLHQWTPADEARAKELGFSRKQVVILASMIEKETGAGFERPIISSVFHNRLKKKMRLQSDPTTIYGMWSRYQGKIHRSDLLAPSEYNTYTLPGLPIGPIASVHPESIKAALYPADTQFLYFVSKNAGTHVFSKTYEEHNGWVKKFQLDPAAREGKSWRDLNKKTDSPKAE
jgi:UPF0755 protein